MKRPSNAELSTHPRSDDDHIPLSHKIHRCYNARIYSTEIPRYRDTEIENERHHIFIRGINISILYHCIISSLARLSTIRVLSINAVVYPLYNHARTTHHQSMLVQYTVPYYVKVSIERNNHARTRLSVVWMFFRTFFCLFAGHVHSKDQWDHPG